MALRARPWGVLVHRVAMNGRDHIHTAIDLVRARVGGRIHAEAELLDARGVDNDVCRGQILISQTRVAAMLARALATHEGRTIEEVLDSLAVAVMEVESSFGTDEPQKGVRDAWQGEGPGGWDPTGGAGPSS
jgi:hypothetical protein